MAACEEIRQSVEVGVPVEVANREWTQFVFWNIYHRPLGLPDDSEAEPDVGFVQLEAIGPERTRATVDLNYCPHLQGMSDSEEIVRVEHHLRETLARYKRFIEAGA